MVDMTDTIDLFIAVDGDNKNDGSIAWPFQSFERVFAEIVRHKHSEKRINVIVRGGKYYFPKAFIIRVDDVGQNSAGIFFQSYNSEQVIISGAVRLHPEWEDYDGKIKVADIGKGYDFDILYMNEIPQILARYPNYQEDTVLNGFSADALSPERVAGWENPEGGFIRAIHNREWGGNSYIITGKTENNELLYSWVGDNNRGCDMHDSKRMVENIFEELDSPGEWFYNKKTGQLFFYPPEGVDINKSYFEAAVNEELIKIIGESCNKPVCNLSFEGFVFTQTHRTLFTRGYDRPLRGDWGLVRAGAIYIENAEGVTIKNSIFISIGGNAVMMSAYNKNHIIDQNDFMDIGASAILVVGLQDAVRDVSTWDFGNHKQVISDFEAGPKTEDFPRQIQLSNNYITNIGTYEKQVAGVCISISEYISVNGNTIHRSPRAGINISDGTFGGHIIEYNDIFDCVRETGDHGPINSWGRDRFWSVPKFDAMGKFGKEKRPYALLDARSTSVIRNNRIHANHAFGIDLDDGSSNYEIYNNLCLGVGIKLREGFERKVYNNILVGACFEIHVSYALNGDEIFENIVYNSKAYNFISVNEGSNTEYWKNLYWNDGKLVFNLPDENEDEGSIISNPLFIDPAINNYSVQENSPALKLGFENFPMGDNVLGRIGKPKPPFCKYIFISAEQNINKFYDIGISNITNEGLRSAAGLPDYNGVFILVIDAIGTFSTYGFRKGDVILSLNRIEVPNVDVFCCEYENLELASKVEAEIFRNQACTKISFIKMDKRER